MSRVINKKRLPVRQPENGHSFQRWMEEHLAQIPDMNSALNALVDVFVDDALDQAKRLDEKRAAGEVLGPLAGMPVSVKANIDVKGHASTHGIPALKQNIVATD